MEGSGQLLSTFIDFLVDQGTIDTGQKEEWKIEDIQTFKAKLNNQLQELLSKQEKFKQGKLNL